MTQRELFEKIQRGDVLDARESLFLEQTLESGDGLCVQSLMDVIEDPEPSLAWRSALNERLQAIAPQPKPGKRWLLLGSGLMATGAAACAVAFGVFFYPNAEPEGFAVEQSAPVVTTQDAGSEASDFEGALIRTHISDEVEVTAGLHTPRMVADSGYDWSSL